MMLRGAEYRPMDRPGQFDLVPSDIERFRVEVVPRDRDGKAARCPGSSRDGDVVLEGDVIDQAVVRQGTGQRQRSQGARIAISIRSGSPGPCPAASAHW